MYVVRLLLANMGLSRSLHPFMPAPALHTHKAYSTIQPTCHMAFVAKCRNGILAIYRSSGRRFVIVFWACFSSSAAFGFR